MPLLERLHYALYVAAVAGAALGLLIALLSADAVRILPTHAFDWIMSPGYMAAVYVVAFIFAPALAERMPISRNKTKEK